MRYNWIVSVLATTVILGVMGAWDSKNPIVTAVEATQNSLIIPAIVLLLGAACRRGWIRIDLFAFLGCIVATAHDAVHLIR